jgi:VIT1/CCC1 family predicted Fe2+/Mn2+ transporter
MAAGEHVSGHSQKDTEDADLALEREELRTDDSGEHKELAAIYVGRGLDPGLAKQVAYQLMANDALGAHAREELGFSTTSLAPSTGPSFPMFPRLLVSRAHHRRNALIDFHVKPRLSAFASANAGV